MTNQTRRLPVQFDLPSFSSPNSFVYLDQEGIQSLYAQSISHPEVERSTAVERTIAGKASGVAKLRNLLLKALVGTDFEVSGEISGSRKNVEQSKQITKTENELAALFEAFERVGAPAFFSALSDAARHIGTSDTKVFVRVKDKFDAPQIQGDESSRQTLDSGYLILRHGDRHDYRDGYYKSPALPVLLQVGVDKMPSSRYAASGHLATYIRGYEGVQIPLSVFGAMFYTPAYFQIKPYAIWI